MSLTRRSCIKKSSYSAAAVTALGTGVALANGTTSNLCLWWKDYEYHPNGGQGATLSAFGPNGLNDNQAAGHVLNAVKSSLLSGANTTVTHEEKRANQGQLLDPPTITIMSVDLPAGTSLSITRVNAGGRTLYSLVIPNGTKVKIRQRFRK